MNRRQIEPVLDSVCGVREPHITKAISAGRTVYIITALMNSLLQWERGPGHQQKNLCENNLLKHELNVHELNQKFVS